MSFLSYFEVIFIFTYSNVFLVWFNENFILFQKSYIFIKTERLK